MWLLRRVAVAVPVRGGARAPAHRPQLPLRCRAAAAAAMCTTPRPPSRGELPAHRLIPTRVQDTDLLGHINNVNYYAFMDSAICDWSAAQGDRVADCPRYVVETGLRYHAPAFYPDRIEVRFGVETIGNSSVMYKVGMFADSSKQLLASGKFVHVYVTKEGRPVRIPDNTRKLLQSIPVGAAAAKTPTPPPPQPR